MKSLLLIFLNMLVVGLFLYSKLLPYKDKLNPKYRKTFSFFDRFFDPFFSIVKSSVKPFQVGYGLFVDMPQIILLIILLFLINLI